MLLPRSDRPQWSNLPLLHGAVSGIPSVQWSVPCTMGLSALQRAKLKLTQDGVVERLSPEVSILLVRDGAGVIPAVTTSEVLEGEKSLGTD